MAVGSDGFFEVKADLNQRIGETTAIRLNAMSRDEDSTRSNPVTGTTPEIHRQGFAPSIAFGLGTDHEVTLSHFGCRPMTGQTTVYPFNSAAKKPESKYGQKTYWG